MTQAETSFSAVCAMEDIAKGAEWTEVRDDIKKSHQNSHHRNLTEDVGNG